MDHSNRGVKIHTALENHLGQDNKHVAGRQTTTPKRWNCVKVGHITRNCLEPHNEYKPKTNEDNQEIYNESDLQAKARLQ